MKTIEEKIRTAKQELAQLKKEQKEEDQRRLIKEAEWEQKTPEEKAEDLWIQAYEIAVERDRMIGPTLPLDEGEWEYYEDEQEKFFKKFRDLARKAVKYEEQTV
jgi:hypothetical protein